MARWTIIILQWFAVVSILPAQTSPDSQKVVKQIGLKVHQGIVLVHSRHLRPIRNSYPTGIELDLAWQKTSAKAWESCHCYPKLGIATSFWDYDHPEILGYGVTGLFYIEPVFSAWRRVSFSIRAGFGLSYQNRPYDEISNPYNQSYSTYVAFPLQLGGSLHFRLKPQWYLDLSAVYNHFSNGGIKEPNKGINWPTGALGVGYYLDRPEFINRIKRNWREQQDPQTRFDLTIFLAYKEPVSKAYIFSPGVELKYSRQIGRISALTFGTEWMFDNGNRYTLEDPHREKAPHCVGAAIGHEFLLGKFLFSQQFGYYLYRPFPDGRKVYQRYALVHRISKRISLGMGLKAHGHIADFLDLRIGVSF